MARRKTVNKNHKQVHVRPMLYVVNNRRVMRHAADCPCPKTAKHGAP